MKKPRRANKSEVGTMTDRIRSARLRAGFSQTALARSIGVTASAAAQWEHPRGTQPSLGRLHRLADALGVAPEWLLTGRTSSGDSEAPALALDVYARDLHEETLLEHFRAMSPHARTLLLQVAHEFDVSKSQDKRKRR